MPYLGTKQRCLALTGGNIEKYFRVLIEFKLHESELHIHHFCALNKREMLRMILSSGLIMDMNSVLESIL